MTRREEEREEKIGRCKTLERSVEKNPGIGNLEQIGGSMDRFARDSFPSRIMITLFNIFV